MLKNRVKMRLITNLIIVACLGVSAGFYALSGPGTKDMVNVYIAAHFSTLVPQSVLLIMMMNQVLVFRSALVMIGIRGRTPEIQKKLFMTVVAEVAIYFATYYGTFVSVGKPAFLYGSALIGGLLLFLRFCLMCFLAVIIVGAFQLTRHSAILLVVTIALNLGYSYILEQFVLLPLYSPYHMG